MRFYRLPADALISEIFNDIFTHDLQSLTPRHLSMLTWCMVSLRYAQPSHCKAVEVMAEKVCRFLKQEQAESPPAQEVRLA